MAKPKEGLAAPAFSTPASNGKTVSLKDFKGKKHVVLYFYPKDNTPGCTIEACELRDGHKKIARRDAIVLGVSPDSLASHDKFIDKFDLPFILLSDEDKKLCKAYGCWIKKSMYGREYMGVARNTYVIGKNGKILKIFEKVKPKGHAEEVLEVLKSA
jgi:peroxiredoxin Q/BCP